MCIDSLPGAEYISDAQGYEEPPRPPHLVPADYALVSQKLKLGQRTLPRLSGSGNPAPPMAGF